MKTTKSQKFLLLASALAMTASFSHAAKAEPDAPETQVKEEQGPDVPPPAQMRRTSSYNMLLPSAREALPTIEWSDAPREAPQALVDAIAIVTQRDPAAQSAWLGARAALANVKGALWLSYPSLTTDLGITNGTNTIAPTVAIEMPLWAGGQISSSIKRARQTESAALARWHETVLGLALEVNQTYFNIVLYSRLEQLYQESLQEHQRLVESMQRRVNQEVSPLADLELARSRTAQIEQELASIHAQRVTALQTLAELVRDPTYQLGEAPQFDPFNASHEWKDLVAEAVNYSPTRARLLYEADAARSEIAIARGAIFPRVSAQYSYNEITGSRVGVGLRLQASNGLSQFSAVSAATSRFEQSLDQVRLAERQLRQEIANEIVTYDAAVRRAAASREASLTADRVSQSYMRQFIAGRRSWLDVMNSLRENLSAQSGLAQAEVLAMSTAVRLEVRSGHWQPVRTSSKD